MESKYPAWQSVYYYFRKWRRGRIGDQILEQLVGNDRELQGRNREASAVAADSQSVKKVAFISIDTGLDANKKVNGRKSYITIDVLGLPLAIHIGPANVHDSIEGIELLPQIEKASSRIELLILDKAYRGDFADIVTECY